MFYLKMSTIAQRKKFKHLSFGFITKKNNLTDVQFSFEESNIHQKILLKKRLRCTMETGKGALETLDSNNAC